MILQETVAARSAVDSPLCDEIIGAYLQHYPAHPPADARWFAQLFVAEFQDDASIEEVGAVGHDEVEKYLGRERVFLLRANKLFLRFVFPDRDQ